jgi:MFS family permease
MKAGTGFPGRAASHRSEDGGSRWSTVVLVVGAGVVSAFQVGKAPTALLAVQADLSLDLSTASWLLSAFAIVGAFTGAAVGIAVDHLGARRMVLGGLLLQAACSALGAMAEGAPLLLAARVIEGLGFLTVTVAAPTLVVGVVAPQGRGRAMAVWGTFMPVGIALVMLAAPLLTAIGWRGFWLVNAAVLLVYAVLLAGGTRRMSPDVASGRCLPMPCIALIPVALLDVSSTSCRPRRRHRAGLVVGPAAAGAVQPSTSTKKISLKGSDTSPAAASSCPWTSAPRRPPCR